MPTTTQLPLTTTPSSSSSRTSSPNSSHLMSTSRGYQIKEHLCNRTGKEANNP